jgi:hypothetical protein
VDPGYLALVLRQNIMVVEAVEEETVHLMVDRKQRQEEARDKIP